MLNKKKCDFELIEFVTIFSIFAFNNRVKCNFKW